MWLTALILGFAGSLHCVGMCSPLATAATNFRSPAFTNKLYYHAGRLLTYGWMGALFATLGHVLNLVVAQKYLSFSLGVILIGIGAYRIAGKKAPQLPLTKLVTKVKVLFGHALNVHRRTSLIVTGMMNGLLPCGLSFLALSYTVTLAGPLDGFNFMLLFGVGTLPALLGFGSIIRSTAGWITSRLRLPVSEVQTIALIALGGFLIVRVWLGHIHEPTGVQVGSVTEVVCN